MWHTSIINDFIITQGEAERTKGFERPQHRNGDSAELDIVVLARLSCGIHLSSITSSSRKGKQKERKVSSDHNIEMVIAQFITPLKWTKSIINERTV